MAAAVLDRQAEEGEPEPEPQAHEGDLWAIEVPDLEPANAWQQPTSTVTSNACQCDPETGFRDPWCDKPEHEGIVSAEPAAEQPAERAESNADAVTADPAPDDTYDDAEPFSIDDDDDTYPPDTLMARLADKFAEPIPTGPDDDRCEYCGEKFATDEEPFHPECQRRAYQGAA